MPELAATGCVNSADLSLVDGFWVMQASAVAFGGRAILIEGPPGTGKSSLALALIHKGATLIGDDGVTLERKDMAQGPAIFVSQPPNIAGLLEVRGVGLATFATAPPTPLALILTLGEAGERLPKSSEARDILSCRIPALPFVPGAIAPAERALTALEMHGLTFPDFETDLPSASS